MFSSLHGNGRSDGRHSTRAKYFCRSEGQNDLCCSYLFTPESIKDALSVFSWVEKHVCSVHSSKPVHLLSFKKPIALSFSRKWTWKYTELAVIICGGLFKFEGNVEGKKDRQAQIQMRALNACWAERVKPGVCLSVYVCLCFTLWLDDVVWANLPEWMVWIYEPTTVKLS